MPLSASSTGMLSNIIRFLHIFLNNGSSFDSTIRLLLPSEWTLACSSYFQTVNSEARADKQHLKSTSDLPELGIGFLNQPIQLSIQVPIDAQIHQSRSHLIRHVRVFAQVNHSLGRLWTRSKSQFEERSSMAAVFGRDKALTLQRDNIFLLK
jgi:hypothetical protein